MKGVDEATFILTKHHSQFYEQKISGCLGQNKNYERWRTEKKHRRKIIVCHLGRKLNTDPKKIGV